MKNIEVGSYWISMDRFWRGSGEIVEIIPLSLDWASQGATIQYKSKGREGGFVEKKNFLAAFRPLTETDKLELL